MDVTIIIIIGLVAVISFLVGLFSFEMHHRQAGSKPATPTVSQPASLPGPVPPPQFNDHLLQQAEANYTSALGTAVQKFNQDLASTSEQINGQIKNLSSMVIADELERYREGLVQLRQQAMAGLSGVEQAVEQQRQARQAAIEAEVKAEKQRLLQQIDTKLNDAVSSFLLETLQHNIDLGAQNAYLMAILDEHKAELKQQVMDEV